MKIVCVGGGPAGLYASILFKLRDPGHEVMVYERSKANTTSGWGVTFGRQLLTELYDQDCESADQIKAAAYCWRDQVVHIRGEVATARGGNAYNISRRRLIELLTSRALDLGVDIVYGTDVLSPQQLPEADLIVAADGINSDVRAAIGDFTAVSVSGSNKYIWLGSDKVFDSFSFLFTQTPHGWVWAYAYGIDHESSTFIVECAANTWASLGFDSISTSEALLVLEGLFKEHLDGYRLIGQLGDGSTARWLNFQTISNPHWRADNVVLIGDSAHTAHFSIGMGTTLAIRDAICLVNLVHERPDLESALGSYEVQRKEDLIPSLAEAQCSARWFENLERYVNLSPQMFGVLLFARRSPLIALLPPVVSYLLREASERITLLNTVRDAIARRTKAIYNRRSDRRRAGATDGARA